MTTTQSKFVSTYNRGLQMTFENGLTISIQFGTGNYCERKNFNASHDDELKEPLITSGTAEIAIWHKASDTWFQFESDQVKGWMRPDEVAEWISYIKHARDLDHLRTLAVVAGLLEISPDELEDSL